MDERISELYSISRIENFLVGKPEEKKEKPGKKGWVMLKNWLWRGEVWKNSCIWREVVEKLFGEWLGLQGIEKTKARRE